MPSRESDARRVERSQPVEHYAWDRPYKPLVSPPSVEENDACAIYASVRKDATPSHEAVSL